MNKWTILTAYVDRTLATKKEKKKGSNLKT